MSKVSKNYTIDQRELRDKKRDARSKMRKVRSSIIKRQVDKNVGVIKTKPTSKETFFDLLEKAVKSKDSSSI